MNFCDSKIPLFKYLILFVQKCFHFVYKIVYSLYHTLKMVILLIFEIPTMYVQCTYIALYNVYSTLYSGIYTVHALLLSLILWNICICMQ